MMFSVVVPVYNVAPYVRACLDSVCGQTMGDWEAICVDDGSTDESGAILDEYAAREPRISVVHQANGGEGSARNAGIVRAKGEWIVFLDADDVLNRRALEVFALGHIWCPTAELVAFGLCSFEEGETPCWQEQKATWRRLDLRREIPSEAFRISFWCCAYRHDWVEGLEFGPLKIGADRVYFIQALERASEMALTDFCGYGYCQRKDSATHSQMSGEKFLHELRHQMRMSEIIESSCKVYSEDELRKIALRLSESYASDYARLSRAERRVVWPEWRAAILKTSEREWICGFRRLFMRWEAVLGLHWLGCWVHWLKRHGCNRRLAFHLD